MLNDVGGDLVFAQQVYGFGKESDVLLAISTSGNARNVILAAKTARAFGMKTIALTGRGGGGLAALCDIAVKVPADETFPFRVELPARCRIEAARLKPKQAPDFDRDILYYSCNKYNHRIEKVEVLSSCPVVLNQFFKNRDQVS